LPKNSKAPGFYLKDENEKFIRLSDFEGKMVYLHFWATWCAPCIKEIPEINKLFSKLNEKNIVLINICLDDNIENWKQIIVNKRLKGKNLICKGNWEKNLRKSYFIEEIPHYTLVNSNGIIIKNKCNDPINELNVKSEIPENK
jgi:thiol-disulfide isomerase/thioredoxin